MAVKVISMYEIKEDKGDFLILEISKRGRIIRYAVGIFFLIFLLFGGIFACISPFIFGSNDTVETARFIIVGILLILGGIGIAYLLIWKAMYFEHNKIIIDGRREAVIWTGGKRKDEYLHFSKIKEVKFLKQKKRTQDADGGSEEYIMYSTYIIKQKGEEIYIDGSTDENYIKNLAERISQIMGLELKIHNSE